MRDKNETTKILEEKENQPSRSRSSSLKPCIEESEIQSSKKLQENHIYPKYTKKELYVIVGSLCLVLFLASLDSTIVSTSLPTIANQLNSLSLMPWVITSNMLCATAVQPIFGKMSDVFGSKEVILFSILVFESSSLLSGLTNSMNMLIFSRGLTGIGRAGISVMAQIVISEIIPIDERGKYTGLFSMTFGVASIIGPLIGGIFTDKVSWRWCFFINIPLGIIASIGIIFLVKTPKATGDFKEKMKRIDFIGIILIVFGLIATLLGLNWGSSNYGWKSILVIVLLSTGILILVLFVFYEKNYAKEPLIPMNLFKIRNVSAMIGIMFFIRFAMLGIIYYMPVYYSVVYRSSATMVGVSLLPLVISWVACSMTSGYLISKTGYYRVFLRIGTFTLLAGSFVAIFLLKNKNKEIQIVHLFISGIGLGLCMQAMIICIQASVKREYVALSTSLLYFSRALSGAVSISLISAVLSTSLSRYLSEFSRKYPEYKEIAENSKQNTDGIYKDSVPNIVKNAVIDAYIKSIQNVFKFLAVVLVISFVLSLITQHFPIKDINIKKETEKKDVA
ncbi:hypothetical protein BB559_005263 [Furculomyces boomerangus]|uniref:Major facilitator superfamily (MFS) profile domain-containing protein n=2 Tax=Harpellales TaxID=61421 RepID=A0A2T9Y9Q5_9FUNG|nr:hypothetical protein BB559_005263 [Furculomyces boomerangus]PVZ98892.1 hypothetical protein BB558_005089 [Smittium angustum]